MKICELIITIANLLSACIFLVLGQSTKQRTGFSVKAKRLPDVEKTVPPMVNRLAEDV